eukprot:4212057-Amphidinium_carterae.2
MLHPKSWHVHSLQVQLVEVGHDLVKHIEQYGMRAHERTRAYTETPTLALHNRHFGDSDAQLP